MRKFHASSVASTLLTLATLVTLAALAACEDAAVTPPPVAPTPPAPTAAASTSSTDEAVPALRLPNDTRPTAEALVLAIDPTQDRFSGTATIDVTLDRARGVVWMHGRGLHVSRATLTPDGAQPIAATWAQKSDDGTASLTLASTAPAGKVRVTIDYDAPFGEGLAGLYKTKQAGIPYAVTQFEAIDARRAFPCFDEPGFKIPFSVSLVVPNEAVAITNAPEVNRNATPDGKTRVNFATTKPLPSYLVAFAVGPFDVVKAADVPPNEYRKTPLQLRALAAKGRGKELAYAVAHTGEIVTTLEKYFGIAYPYEKLDIIAAPDKQGAMENAGAVMFSEGLLLLDEGSPLGVKTSYAYVAAHELAHQWFGDLVTMEWWNDLWLNESFATWMGYKTADRWNPAWHFPMEFADQVQGSMGSDSLVSARQIRQPIVAHGDIENAFDGITYGKGGAVLGMFERWLGPEKFQSGVHAHLTAHPYGSATADDFLGALSTAAGRDVKVPFHTFLDQPGVPFIEAAVTCEGAKGRVLLKQSRYLPTGSKGDPVKTWQVPVCARYSANGKTAEACTLLTESHGELPLAACPDWVMPNAGGAGYYRFALAADDLKKLRTKGLAHLQSLETVAYANALRAAFNRATTPFADLMDAAAPLINDAQANIAQEPLGLAGQAHDWLYGDPLRAKTEAYERKLAAPVLARLGLETKKGEDADRTMLRHSIFDFLVLDANDPATRAEAKKRGLLYLGKDDRMHPEAVDTNLAYASLAVVAQEADEKTWNAMLAKLQKTDDDLTRGRLLGALSSVRDPKLSARARDLVMGDVLRVSERLGPLYIQMADPGLRDAAWDWVKTNFDAVLAKVKDQGFGGVALLGVPSAFCDTAHADEVEAFLAPRLDGIEGGARAGASTIEGIRLCAAKRGVQEQSARAFFSKTK